MNYYTLNFKILDQAYTATNMQTTYDFYVNKNEGIPLEKELLIELPKKRGIITDYIDNVQGLLIVSKEIATCFYNVDEDNIELIPVKIERKALQDYFFINILKNIDCIDFENTIYDDSTLGKKIFDKIDQLELLHDKIDERHYFRMKHLESELIVSEYLKDKLEHLNTDILQFIDIKNYTYDVDKIEWDFD